MIAVPSADPVGALVPHTLKEPLIGGSSGPLAGTSFMVKDLFAIKGRKVSNGSPDFYGHATPARETAPVITRLLEAGASCTGITVCDEFFYSVLGSNIHYGQPVNARAPKHVTGGSSCGAAAAVAASMCNFALGTDTAGSIRVPASFCGLYGLRPTYGRIDTTGATPMAPSYDTVGFLARDFELFRKVGHVLLQGATAEAKIERLILAENFFRHAEASMDQALWEAIGKIGGALPRPEHVEIDGEEEVAAWRNAFRLIQGFEIQSTLLPFIQSRTVELGPGIKERFDMAAAITLAEADACARLARRNRRPPARLDLDRDADRAAHDADAAARARYSGRRVLLGVPRAHARIHLPCRPFRPAAGLGAGRTGCRLPGGSFLHWLARRRRDAARSCRPS